LKSGLVYWENINQVNKMELLERLQWRFAAKAMSCEKVPQDKIDRVIEAARLAETSSCLQGFEIYIVTNQEVKEKIKPVAWNQSTVTHCSHLLVFAVWDTYSEHRFNAMFDLTNEIRGFKNKGWENYRQQLISSYPQKGGEEDFNHAAKQAYIAFTNALVAAAFKEVDATPMESFDTDTVDEILGLREKGRRSTVLLPIGYRKPTEDWLVNLEKVRKSTKKLVTVAA
jgi:nitroreductase/dihydropteridine reductase